MAAASEELNLYLFLIVINLNVNSQMWLVATVLDTEAPGHTCLSHEGGDFVVLTAVSLEWCLAKSRYSINI